MKQNLVLILFIFSIILFSCKNKTAEVAESESGLVEITKAQFESEKMEIGLPIISVFADLVHFTGVVAPSVSGRAQISLPAQGLITKIHCTSGQSVTKGALLFEVSGNEFIDMQKDLAESAAQLNRLKTEYERQKEMIAENIGAKKDLISAESAFNVEKAKHGALKLKIEILGLEPSKIEQGEFYTFYTIKAPISGFVNSISTNIGQYVEPQQTIAEIIDTRTFQLKLSVFGTDIDKVKEGQEVNFYLAGNKAEKLMATVKIVGKLVNSDTKSIECFAEIKSTGNFSLIGNQFVEGDIIVAADSVLSVPESAILKSESESYLLAFEKEADELIYFSRLKVKPGRSNNDFIEITEIPSSTKILTTGAYNIQIE
jgi:cobalt-zinc-cadmium efflux system membrane fusion protein